MTRRKFNKLRPRQKVVLIGLPDGFVDDLPEEDQTAILEVVGKQIILTEYDEDGRAVLSFTDKRGLGHDLYVDPKFIAPTVTRPGGSRR